MNTSRSSTRKQSTTSRYRKVSRGSDVDESLFGDSAATKQLRARSSRQAGKNIIKNQFKNNNNNQEDQPSSSRQHPSKSFNQRSKAQAAAQRSRNAAAPKSTKLTMSELNRIKAETRIITASDMEDMIAAKEAQEERDRLKAKERKNHMIQKAAEVEKRKPKTEMELVFEHENQQILERAKLLQEQTHDSVKLLKTLGARASAFTIRDQQLKEHETRGDDDKLYDEKMNLRMEIDRLEDLKRLEDIEEAKRKKRFSDRLVLEQQIKARKEELAAQALRTAEEGKAMLRRLDQEQAEDEQREKDKILRQQRDMEKVMEFNEQAIEIKKRELEKIREEEEAVVAYQRKKDEEQRLWEEEQERIKEEAEARCMLLRSQQEKIQNGKSELDELRAKRAAEAKERQFRESELAAERRRKQTLQELSEARLQQALHKRRSLEKEAQMQQEEYEATMKRVKADKDRLELELKQKEIKNKVHREGIQLQIEELQLGRKRDFEARQADGRELREEYDNELKELERIRKKEVDALIKSGVNPQYLAEMQNIDISKIRNC